jgi:hypothetical protein
VNLRCKQGSGPAKAPNGRVRRLAAARDRDRRRDLPDGQGFPLLGAIGYNGLEAGSRLLLALSQQAASGLRNRAGKRASAACGSSPIVPIALGGRFSTDMSDLNMKPAFRSGRRSAVGLFALYALIGSLMLSGAAQAAPDVRAFIEGLRERGYFDTAAEYLERVADSPLISEQDKQAIAYELGVIMVQAANQIRDPALRENQFDQAQAKLREFLDKNPDHPLATSAKMQLANVLVERGRALVSRAERPGQDKARLHAEARKLFAEAEKAFTAAAAQYRAELDKIPVPTPPNLQDRREELGREWLQARLLVATVIYESSKATEPGSKDHKELLESSAAKYRELYEGYNQRLVGLYARLYEGRNYHEMGDSKRALSTLTDLIDMGDKSPELRRLKNRAFRITLELWLDLKDYETAIQRGGPWAESARGAEVHDPDWLAVKYLAASAYQAKLESMKPTDKDYAAYQRKVRDLATEVGRVRNPYQDQARALLAVVGRAAAPAAEDKPKTFDEAYDRGRLAIEQMQSAEVARNLKQQQGDTEGLGELADQAQEHRDEAFNQARFLLAYLHLLRGNPWEAAVLGEFLARNYPQFANARRAATIARAAFQTLYQEAPENDRDFEMGRVAAICDLIIRNWPDQPEADDARNLLMAFALQQQDLPKVRQLLGQMAEATPRRFEAEMRVGRVLWDQYRKSTQLPDSERLSQAELDALAEEAMGFLQRGVQGLRESGEADLNLVAAVLALANMHLYRSEPDRAVALLEDEKIGPLTLIKADHPATGHQAVRSGAYMAALQAYVSVEPQQVQKAEEMLDALEKSFGDDAAGGERLTALLIKMGRELQEQLRDIQRRDDPDKLQRVSRAFEAFISRIPGRKNGNTFQSLNWVADSYYNLAEGVMGESGVASPQAAEYFKKAIATDQEILDRAAKDDAFLPNKDLTVAIRTRMARSHRAMGQFDEAIKILAGILKERNTLLSAQIEAAKTYQLRGAKDKPGYYELAIAGGRLGDNRNIWGWGKLASITASRPEFSDIHHEARYNLALCRKELAASKSGNRDEQKKLYETAKRDIYITFVMFPEMGGDAWRPKYDSLLREVQRALRALGVDEPTDGLEALKRQQQAVTREVSSAGP